MSTPIANRYDFVYLFDITNGNPNGDPDAGNLPRVDPETGHGIVTDVCLKRKVRNFVAIVKNYTPPFDIFVRESMFLNTQIERAYEESETVKSVFAQWQAHQKKKEPKPKTHYEELAKQWMCETFYDIRTFGAVMSTKDKETSKTETTEDTAEEKTSKPNRNTKSKIAKTAGQVRGPVQLAFAKSTDPVRQLEASIARVCATSEEKPDQKGIIGRKNYVPYGLYCAHGFISPHFAAATGFADADLELLWEALINMFEHDKSAARTEMYKRKLIIFKHDSALGNAHAHELFARVSAAKKPDVAVPRAYSDYTISIDATHLPHGITIIEK